MLHCYQELNRDRNAFQCFSRIAALLSSNPASEADGDLKQALSEFLGDRPAVAGNGAKHKR